MKKLLLIFAVALFVAACSEDKKDDDTLYFISVQLSYNEESGKGPEGSISVYYIEYAHPQVPYDLYGSYLKNINGEPIIPRCSQKLRSSKNSTTGLYENKSVNSFYSSDLFYSDDSPLLGKYLIVVEVDSGWDDGTLLGVGKAYYIEDFDFQGETHIEHSIPQKNPSRINYW